MKNKVILKTIFFNCISCNRVYSSFSPSTVLNFNINVCISCSSYLTRDITGLKSKNIDNFKLRLKNKLDKDK